MISGIVRGFNFRPALLRTALFRMKLYNSNHLEEIIARNVEVCQLKIVNAPGRCVPKCSVLVIPHAKNPERNAPGLCDSLEESILYTRGIASHESTKIKML